MNACPLNCHLKITCQYLKYFPCFLLFVFRKLELAFTLEKFQILKWWSKLKILETLSLFSIFWRFHLGKLTFSLSFGKAKTSTTKNHRPSSYMTKENSDKCYVLSWSTWELWSTTFIFPVGGVWVGGGEWGGGGRGLSLQTLNRLHCCDLLCFTYPAVLQCYK